MARTYTQKTQTMPLIPLRGITVFPSMVLHFDVGREKSIYALNEALEKDEELFLVSQKDIRQTDDFSIDDLYLVGTICHIKQILKLPGNNVRVLAEGVNRAELKELYEKENYYEGKITRIMDKDIEPTEKMIALMRSILSEFEKYVSMEPRISPEVIFMLSEIKDPVKFCDIISSNVLLKTEQNQDILSQFNIEKRLLRLHEILNNENKILQIEKKLSSRVKKEMSKNEKEFYLREQMKAIHKELGDESDPLSDVQKYKDQLEKLEVDQDIKEKIEREINKLSRASRSSADAEVTRNYLDTVFDLPWNESTKEDIDIKKAEKILDEDHYGLEDVKTRIIEYLAVKKLSNSMKGPIICLVGPPGVGKTSIAKSIARAVGRNFERISLGGVRDEAQIRGHRRTYVGAIPGRVINAMISAKTNNPVILFDELDKMASDFKGDPASAMLEVLDPEQNKNFTDHYVDLPFDLSKTMFICTANSLNGVPAPLIDRMEVIEVSGYTHIEKLQIAKKYLVPKQIKEHSLEENFVVIGDDVILEIIDRYTRESGVRSLEREIGKVCRKSARRKVENPNLSYVRITKKNLEKYLGKPRYDVEMKNEKPQVGIVRGLAWTQVGGVTLSTEVNIMPGTGKISLTGQLGNVMKESAQTAYSYVRSISDKYGIKNDFYEKTDIHVHIPEGATPKDGPSAGITMATAILSALSGIKVKNDLAMTGEITLRGRVLPIGGVKEKVLAANRAGIKNIILPQKNEKDIDDIPEEIRKNLNIKTVNTMDEVLDLALVKEE